MARILVALAFFLFLGSAQASIPGTVTSPAFTYSFGSAPGQDQFSLSGTYVLGTGGAVNLPSDAFTVSFDNGRLSWALPANSFQSVAGGWKYTASSSTSGITLVSWNANGTFQIHVKNSDFTGTDPTKFGAIVVTEGNNQFTFIPNSVPVARITGPTAAVNVGTLVTLDGSQSTDFNGLAMTSTWSVVSQPSGSSIALSSTNQATTSFTPSANGAYVLKLVNSAAGTNGVPALYTVSATGGATPPPPAPGPDNGLCQIQPDHGSSSYTVGQQATFSFSCYAQLGNPQIDRFYFVATYDDQPVTLGDPNNPFFYTTPDFTAAGMHTFKVVQFVEGTDVATDLASAIASYQADIQASNAALKYETNPSVIQQLQNEIASDQAQILVDQQKQQDNRSQIAGPAVLTINVTN